MRTFASLLGIGVLGVGVIAAGVLALASAGVAGVPAEPAGRYSMTPTEGGVIRLDTQTGAMALCTRKSAGQWSCEDMNDAQRAAAAEVERLQAENKALNEQIDRLEETLGLNGGAGEAPKPGVKLSLPTEADVDKAFDYLERMLDKLHERVEKFEKRHPRGGGTAL